MRIKALISRSLAAIAAIAMLHPSAIAQSKAPSLSPHLADAKAETLPLGLPIRKVMNAVIDFWAFGVLYLSESKSELSSEDWRSLELASLHLTVAATSITTPGPGPDDADWVAETEWRRWAKEMQQAGLMLEDAVQKRSRTALRASANRLADACLSCHTAYKPKQRAKQFAEKP